MYHQPTPQQKKEKPQGRAGRFFAEMARGGHLLRSWRKWLGWVITLTIVAVLFIHNERVIDEKEAKIKELEETHRKLMLKLKDVNDVVLMEESEERAKAREDGFEDIKEYDYYEINK